MQQRQSGEKSPELRVRRRENEPVINSRVGAFKEMSGAKVRGGCRGGIEEGEN